MSIADYRRQYAQELDKVSRAGRRTGVERVAALLKGAQPTTDALATKIATLGDQSASPDDRRAALRDVQTVSFLGRRFDRYRASYRQALRNAATATDQELRETALELLAIEKDEIARDLLVTGLEDSTRQLVAPDKAIQFLAHDDHGMAIPIARKMIAGNYDEDAKTEALRVLASDPDSGDLFARLLDDRSQPDNLRSLSAAALRLISPQRFVGEAQRIVADKSEAEMVKAACLGALTHLQGTGIINLDAAFTNAVAELQSASVSAPLRAAARRFLKKHEP